MVTSQNSYKPSQDLREATRQRLTISVQLLARFFCTEQGTPSFFIFFFGGVGKNFSREDKMACEACCKFFNLHNILPHGVKFAWEGNYPPEICWKG